MLPSETMIWQPEFTDKTLSRKPGAVQYNITAGCSFLITEIRNYLNCRNMRNYRSEAVSSEVISHTKQDVMTFNINL
ncbi:hypothetical protein E7U94_20155 [Escherichia coli]|nr:hypothetical protein C7V21_05655 [Escherichia coli]EEX2823991.1 hypothetical protein [Escherichia coli]EFB3709459.1 hypothetical protein [Escherichia coli]MBG0889734.1 hypothetical protein [Escherichia coli]MDI4250979.1 hypothetical protein [Escherichia coli]